MSEQQSHRSEDASSATSTADTAQQMAPETTAKAQEIGARIQDEAERLTQEAKVQGQAMLQDQKHAIAEQIGSVANALRTTAKQLKTQEQDDLSNYTQQAADGLEQVSQTLKDRDLNTLMGDVEDFARNQPGAFIGSAALLGFMAARFLKSSAARRSTSATTPSTQMSYGSGPAPSTAPGAIAASSQTSSSVARPAVSPVPGASASPKPQGGN